MALVDYSDSESDSEAPRVQDATKVAPPAKAAFQKAAPGKIKVEIPSIKPEPGQGENGISEGPPAKRARTGGAFNGFNSILPAPKRTAQNTPRAGINLKTSSEAAFTRNPPPKVDDEQEYDGTQLMNEGVTEEKKEVLPPTEPKLIGKATRFLPLSVSNKKKKKPIAKSLPVPESTESNRRHNDTKEPVTKIATEDAEAMPKPKKSLFLVQEEEISSTPIEIARGGYQPIMIREEHAVPSTQVAQPAVSEPSISANPNSLEATAADLNLTASQRRQLFGRNGGKGANVMHFNLDSEYAANEQARQAGEVIEHRAVKAIAPGKHSLQQLVNNARTQQDAMEDKWAEGRRNRGEGGSKYGWSG